MKSNRGTQQSLLHTEGRAILFGPPERSSAKLIWHPLTLTCPAPQSTYRKSAQHQVLLFAFYSISTWCLLLLDGCTRQRRWPIGKIPGKPPVASKCWCSGVYPVRSYNISPLPCGVCVQKVNGILNHCLAAFSTRHLWQAQRGTKRIFQVAQKPLTVRLALKDVFSFKHFKMKGSAAL